MNAETDVEFLIAVPFDYSLFIEPDLLGAIRPIHLASSEARIEFPRNIPEPLTTLALLPPVSAPERFSPHLPDDCWGLRRNGKSKLSELHAVLVVVPVRTHLPSDWAENQIGGEGAQKLCNEVDEWFNSFCHWLCISTAQSLDPINPDPKVIHRRSKNLIIAISSASQSSLLSSGSPTIKIIIDTVGPQSERLVGKRVLDLACSRAGKGKAPMTLELLASARMAARRGDWRRALVDAGTASEGALTRALGLPPDHQLTLGNLVKRACAHGLKIPKDTHESLVDLRNDAVHRGKFRTGHNRARALEIAEEIVSLAEPDLIPVSALHPVHRPQRMDLTIIKPPEP